MTNSGTDTVDERYLRYIRIKLKVPEKDILETVQLYGITVESIVAYLRKLTGKFKRRL